MIPTGYTPSTDERTRLRNEVKSCMWFRRGRGLTAETREYWRSRAISAIARLRALSAAPVDIDNTTITARLEWLESAIDEAAPDAVPKMLTEIIELRNRLQLDGWADEQADGRIMARNLSDTY